MAANPRRNIEGYTRAGAANQPARVVAICSNINRHNDATFDLILQEMRTLDFKGVFRHAKYHLNGGDLDGWLEVSWHRLTRPERGPITKYYWFDGQHFEKKAPRSIAGVRRVLDARAQAAAAALPVPVVPPVVPAPLLPPVAVIPVLHAAAAAPAAATAAAAAPAHVSPGR